VHDALANARVERMVDWRPVGEPAMTEQGKLVNLSVGTFLDRLAERTPTPGGGAVAGVCGALACALAHMVGAYRLGPKTPAENRTTVEGILTRLGRAEQLMRALIDEDAEAYAALAACPREPTDQTAIGQRQTATLLATAVPLEMCAVASDALEVIEALAPVAGAALLSDLEAAAILAEATVRCAGCTVRVNTGEVRDQAAAGQTLTTLAQIEDAAVRKLQAVQQAIRGRVQPPGDSSR
jgi:formiminotetrahydrofolate cyclodeaminase